MIQSAIKQDTTSPVGIVDRPAGLSAIRDPLFGAAIWWREFDSGCQSWLNALAPEQLPNARTIVKPVAVGETVSRICDASGTPDCPKRAVFVGDVAALADTFTGIMDAPWLRLRLAVVTTNACRKFHVDAITARLVCTYRGTGTQYGVSVGDAAPDQVFTTPTAAPIVMRGTKWDTGVGLLHRSPPIEGTGETRLVLVLDPVMELEDDF
ncbi:MAG: DUF1826 domain-containing protein [Pseudomonadota bacterium]